MGLEGRRVNNEASWRHLLSEAAIAWVESGEKLPEPYSTVRNTFLYEAEQSVLLAAALRGRLPR